MKQRYQIITIYEEDHGCEGIPEGEEPMDQVLLRTEVREPYQNAMCSAILPNQNWNEGDWILWEIE